MKTNKKLLLSLAFYGLSWLAYLNIDFNSIINTQQEFFASLLNTQLFTLLN